MTLYPKWKPDAHPADHLLFDLGYSYGLLIKAEEIFRALISPIADDELAAGMDRILSESERIAAEVKDLLARMESLKAGRMQMRNEIYDAAQEAARRAQP